MGYIAENTIKSVIKALEFKVDGIEVDVHKCKSGELVVFHDFTLDRMTNGTGEISQYSLSELKKLKVNDEYEIPTLEEVLNEIDKKCFINIELKGRNTAQKSSEIIEFYIEEKGWSYQDVLVSSFQHEELKTVYNLNKNISLAVLTKASITEAMDFAKTIKAKAIHPNVSLVTAENIKGAQQNGYLVNVWTVNDNKAIKRMNDYQVNGIISDFPDKL